MNHFFSAGRSTHSLRVGLLLLLVTQMFAQSAYAEDWVYSVRKGDTLWDLCLKYTVKKDCWLKIGDYNGVKYPKVLAPATRIRFPVAWLKDTPAQVEIYHVIGEVRAVQETRVTEVKQGDKLGMGAMVRVGDKSTATLRFADGSLMILTEGSELSLDTLSSHGKNGMVDSRVHLKSGSVSVKVPKRTPRSRFEVSTPSAVAAVRGTEFRVNSSESMRSEVVEGEILVSKKEMQTPVPSGFGVRVVPGPSPIALKELLPAPEFKYPKASEGVESFHLPLTIHWVAPAGTLKSHIRLLNQDGDQQLASFIALERVQEWGLNPTPGCYVVQLSAEDEDGFVGLPSEQMLCLENKLAQPMDVGLSETGALTWAAVPNAKSYRIEFSKTEDFKKTTYLGVQENQVELDGDYSKARFARVIGISEAGLLGETSEHVQLKEKKFPLWAEFLIFISPALFVL